MGAHLGNKYRQVLVDPKIRQEAYKSFCDHIAHGKAIESWYFDKDEHLCCYKTMLNYIKKNPEEFPTIQRSISEAKGYQYWEGVVEDSARGKNPAANTASLQMIMRNKFGWDKRVDEEKGKSQQVLVRIESNGIGSGLNVSAEGLPATDHPCTQ